MSNRAQFRAKLTKLNLANKSTLTLELPEDFKPEELFKIAKMRGMHILVNFGDPQMTIEDYDDEDGGYPEREMYTAPQGLKATVNGQGVVESVAPATEGQADAFEVNVEGQEPSAGSDMELDFEETTNPATDEETPGSQETEGVEISKEAVEQYILTEKPRFSDIEFNPDVFAWKVETNSSWVEACQKYGISSSKLQTSFQKYKNRVKEILKSNGAA